MVLDTGKVENAKWGTEDAWRQRGRGEEEDEKTHNPPRWPAAMLANRRNTEEGSQAGCPADWLSRRETGYHIDAAGRTGRSSS